MTEASGPPPTYFAFIDRYPLIHQAWDLLHEAEKQGPLNAEQIRLVKLGIAIGAMKEGAVHAAARKALAAGVSPQAIEQVVALSASAIGLPSAVAIFSWLREHLGGTADAARSSPRAT
jgi:alkylhydroperoxidase/carboxymuconolactone decarboxylase family protein YurZ